MDRPTPTRHRVRRGLDLPISGQPEQRIDDAPAVRRVALIAGDYVGMRPRMAVAVGDRVRRGQLLYENRKNPGALHVAPGAGTVVDIVRGEQRALVSVVIELDDAERDPEAAAPEVEYASYHGRAATELSGDEVRALLCEAGLWTVFRSRPFNRVPAPDARPSSIFVTAIDTQPLAPRPEVVLTDRADDFATGLIALAALAGRAPLRLCRAYGSTIGDGASARVEIHEFDGPHPAGTAGLHIHLIAPAGRSRNCWHVGYQDVAAIGALVARGRREVSRVVALAGPGVRRPRLLRTRIGAALDELTATELAGGEQRVISGSVLSGRTAMGPETGYLGRYHNQVTVLPEGRKRRFLGWLGPGLSRFSSTRLFLSGWLPGRRYALDTDLNGGPRALVPTGAFERVCAFDLLPTFLLRSLLAGDVERAEELGCLELDEEDVALFSFVCPSKNDYGSALRQVLSRIEKEG